MNPFFVPTTGPSDWRRLLAHPGRQWREGRSAYELAMAWEAAKEAERGLPPDVARAMDAVPELAGASLLLGLPEHQVELVGGGHASQTDLWALLRAGDRLISLAVEAKAGEPFDKLVAEWLKDASEGSGKPARLDQLCSLLQITHQQAEGCRYQLLHRPASAMLEAVRFGASDAVLLVQSFARSPDAFTDFSHFAQQLGATAREDAIVPAGERGGVRLWLGWLWSSVADVTVLRAAVR